MGILERVSESLDSSAAVVFRCANIEGISVEILSMFVVNFIRNSFHVWERA